MRVGVIGVVEARAVVRDLAHRRSGHRAASRSLGERLADLYSMAIAAVVFLSAVGSRLEGAPVAAFARFVSERGASAAGVVVALSVLAGLRSGSFGGPLFLSSPDIVTLALAPVPSRTHLLPRLARALLRVMAIGGGVGAFAVGVASSRIGDDPLPYVLAGAAAGAAAASVSFAAAVATNALRVGPHAALAAGLALVAWTAIDVWLGRLSSPASWIGAVAVWPSDAQPNAVALAAALAVLLPAVALAFVRDVDVPSAFARSDAVSALTAAVALQDIRGLFLVAHSRPDEWPRSTPWTSAPPRRAWPVWTRAWRGVLRFPAARVVRLIVYAAATGVIVVAAQTVTAMVVFAIALCYVLAIEAVEPIAQTVDRPTSRAGLPLPADRLLVRMLAPSMVMLVVFHLVMAAGAAVAGDVGVARWLVAVSAPGSATGAASAARVLVRGKPDVATNMRFFADQTGVAIWAFHLTPAVTASAGVIAVVLVPLFGGGIVVLPVVTAAFEVGRLVWRARRDRLA